MGTEFSIPTTGAHADFIAELLNTLALPHSFPLLCFWNSPELELHYSDGSADRRDRIN